MFKVGVGGVEHGSKAELLEMGQGVPLEFP